MNKNNYELNVLVNGKPVREYFHNNRFFIEAKDGTEYSLKLKNHSHKKIMAVISVDGVDVLKGGKDIDAESGYIVNPYSSISITGYRIDDDNVAAFKFSDGKKSYATEIEKKFDPVELAKVEAGEVAPAKNNGVIGIRIWEEKEPMVIPEWQSKINNKIHYYNNYSFDGLNITGISRSLVYSGAGFITGRFYPLNSNPSGYLSSISISGWSGPMGAVGSVGSGYTPNFSLGTTWGKQIEDKVIKTKFIKAEAFIDLEVFYLTRDEMGKMGIDFENAKKVFVSGFPKSFEDDKYCKKPVDWKGGK